jgi:release factor glutamine methyltransferase
LVDISAVKLDLSIDIDLLPEVYSPGDDSYLLLEAVEVSPNSKLLDIGTGSGIIALHAAKLGARVTATDINPSAVQCARANAFRNDLKMEVVESDLFDEVKGFFDVITFNPPYLPSDGEPSSWVERSWSGGSDGSEIVMRFLDKAWFHLGPKGRIYVVLSSLGSLRSVLRSARERYEGEMLTEKHMFFESIFAYRFTCRL